MEFVKKIINLLPFPKNLFLRIFVGLFYLYLAFAALPLFIAIMVVLYFYKKSPKKTVKYGSITAALFVAFIGGAVFMSGSSDTTTTKPEVLGTKNEEAKVEPTIEVKETPIPTATLTPVPSITIIKAKTPTPIPTKKISTPTPTKKIIYPTATPKPYVAPATATPAPQVQYVAPPSTSGGSSGGGDKDCGDFSGHAEAQAFFLANGGPGSDPHRLDGDNDGQACED